MIKHLSVTQLLEHQYSPKRWVLKYVEGIKEPETPHLEFGQWLHTQMEVLIPMRKEGRRFVRKAHEIISDSITNKNVLKIINWLNENDWLDIDYRIEDDFKSWIDTRLPPFKGRIDAWKINENGKILTIVDHKTVTKGYEKTGRQLREDLQMKLYAQILCAKFFPEVINFIHIQFFKNKLFEIIDIKTVDESFSRDELFPIVFDTQCRNEAERIVETYNLYKLKGLDSIALGNAKEWHYGKKDYYWPLLNGKTTIEEFKKRNNINV